MRSPSTRGPGTASGQAASRTISCGDLDLRIQMPDTLFRLVSHPPTIVTDILGEAPALPFHLRFASNELACPSAFSRTSGFTGSLPANLGGISIIALFIRTATGFRSLA